MGVKPSQFARGNAGISNTNTNTRIVATDNNLPGGLLKKGSLVRTTSTISIADITDSVNQPV